MDSKRRTLTTYLGLTALFLVIAVAGWASLVPGELSVPPTVTLNQAIGQADPTGAAPIHFTVVFSEVVTDFASGDVTLTGTAPGALASTVTGSGTTYDVAVTGMTGSGTVIASLAAGVAHDAVGNASEASTSTDNTVTYITIDLGTAAGFAAFGGTAGMTNQGVDTIINGDIGTTGVSTTMTGFHDSTGDEYIETPLNIGNVTGRIYTDAPPPVIYAPGGPFGGTAETKAIADAAALAALDAYNYLEGLATTGPDPSASGELSGLTVAPGVYKAAGDTFNILPGGTLTLDAEGDANAVWVFQMGASLTVGEIGAGATPARVVFKDDVGQAANVYWQVGSAATINTGAEMVGTIIASSGVTFSTAGEVILTTLDGRALSLNASVTMVNTHIGVPASSPHWALREILACIHAGIVQGYSDGTYHPEFPVSRDQMAVYIARSIAAPFGEAGLAGYTPPETPTFADVDVNCWAFKYIEYVYANNIVRGYGDGFYHPTVVATRDQMAVYVSRAKGWVSIDDDMTVAPEIFPDVPAGFWAGTAIEACVDNGVIRGYDDGCYRPEWQVTRDQMAVYIARAFQLPL